MINRSLATRDRAVPAPGAPEPRIVSYTNSGSGEVRPPLVMWIYVARGVGRIILSVLALPFV